MARKKKRKRRVHVAPLLLATALLAVVVWAVIPHRGQSSAKHGHRLLVQSVSPSSAPAPQASPAAEATPRASPEATASASPAPSTAPLIVPTQAGTATVAKVAIIIDDCGQWPDTERGYLQLPIPLTLAVLPHVTYTSQISQEAADAGKGVMLHLPMEPISHRRAGPGEIETSMTDDQVTEQTENDLAAVPLAQGFNNHEGSEASSDARVMKDVVAVAKSHDLFFIDSRTSAKTVGAAEASAEGVPSASRDVFLDNRADVAYTESMLERTVAIAERNGSAIAIGHPKPTTLEALRAMYPRMQAAGVEFVLAKQLVH